MALPNLFPVKERLYTVATTTSSGAPVSTAVMVARCKYIGGWFVPNSAGTGTNVTGFDVLAYIGGSPTAQVISSGTSVTTTTGTQGSPILVTNALTLNAGDIITTVGSTSQAGFVTHVLQEF